MKCNNNLIGIISSFFLLTMTITGFAQQWGGSSSLNDPIFRNGPIVLNIANPNFVFPGYIFWAKGSFELDPANSTTTEKTFLNFGADAATSAYFAIGTGGTFNVRSGGQGTSTTPFQVRGDGVVVIGSTIPQTSTAPFSATTCKLVVDGKIGAREIVVTAATTWPDYVFKSDYNLKPLEDVKKHIQKEGHLEGIPSQKEIAANGIPVGEMQANLLKKVEELTLYMIALKEENNQLKTKVAAIEKKVQ